jgi:hypothetical protein
MIVSMHKRAHVEILAPIAMNILKPLGRYYPKGVSQNLYL